MFKIESKTIHCTRGDTGTIKVSAKNSDGTNYTFQVGDVVSLNVVKKKDFSSVVLHKEVTVTTSGTTVDVALTSEETRIGDTISSPVTYWFEIELNPETSPQTIVGYDEDGAKEFILYPEAVEEEE